MDLRLQPRKRSIIDMGLGGVVDGAIMGRPASCDRELSAVLDRLLKQGRKQAKLRCRDALAHTAGAGL
jgi:hypothetical protein